MSELRPGASGFLGSTGGVTDDGHAIVVARFESAAATQANSARPEQDIETYLGGGSNDAGFVQVMKNSGIGRARLHALDNSFEDHAGSFSPDFIGGLRVWTGPGSSIEVAHFGTPPFSGLLVEIRLIGNGVEAPRLSGPVTCRPPARWTTLS